MENNAIHVRDLDPDDRAVFERVIGYPLHENMQLVIQVVATDAVPSSASAPDAATAHLPEWSDVYTGLSDDQVAEMRQEPGPEAS